MLNTVSVFKVFWPQRHEQRKQTCVINPSNLKWARRTCSSELMSRIAPEVLFACCESVNHNNGTYCCTLVSGKLKHERLCGENRKSSPPAPATAVHLTSCPTCRTCRKTSPRWGGWTETSGCCIRPQSPRPHPSNSTEEKQACYI